MPTNHTRPQTHSLLWGLVLVAAAIPSPGGAQTIPSPYAFIEDRQAVDVQFGYHFTSQGQFNMGPKSAPLFGARWGIVVSGPFTIELGGWYSPATRDVIDLIREPESQKIGEADMQLFAPLADLRFNLVGDRTWNRLTPYLVVGGGAIFDFAGTQEADLLLEPDQRFSMGTSLLARTGLGSALMLTRHIELKGDAIFQLYKIKTPGGWLALQPELGPLPQDQWVNSWALTLGFGWRF